MHLDQVISVVSVSMIYDNYIIGKAQREGYYGFQV